MTSPPQNPSEKSSNSEEPLPTLEKKCEDLIKNLQSERLPSPTVFLCQETLVGTLKITQELTKELQKFFAVTGMTDRSKLNLGKMEIYRKSTIEERTYLIAFYKALYFAIQSFELGKIGILKVNPEVTQGPLAEMIKCLFQTIGLICGFFHLAGPIAGVIHVCLKYFLKRRAEKQYERLAETTTRMTFHHFDFLTSSEVENACLQTAISLVNDTEKRDQIHKPPTFSAKPGTFFGRLAYYYHGYIRDYRQNKLLNAQGRTLTKQEDEAHTDVYLLFVYLALYPRAFLSEKSMDKIFVDIILHRKWSEFPDEKEDDAHKRLKRHQVLEDLKKLWKQ